MSEYPSGLPIRSESDGVDEKVVAKLVDGTVGGSNQMSIDADKNAHVEVHGNDPAGLDRVLRLSELGALTPDGDYDAANNTVPGSVGVIWHDRAGTTADIHQNFRPTGVQGAANTDVHAIDVALHDENGDAFTASNPMPVTLVDSEGVEVNQYLESTAVAAGANVTHDYTVTALKTFKGSQVEASASGKMIAEIQVETAAASGVFNTKWKLRNSTANPNIQLSIKELLNQVAGAKIRIILTNKDNQAMDMNSTLSGHEI
jgi:hypothetical protein